MVEEESEYGSGGRQQGIAAEILGRHRKSTQPESQQVCAVLGAVLEVVKGEGLEPTPTALFAALMSALENDATRSTAEVRPVLPGSQIPDWAISCPVLQLGWASKCNVYPNTLHQCS